MLEEPPGLAGPWWCMLTEDGLGLVVAKAEDEEVVAEGPPADRL